MIKESKRDVQIHTVKNGIILSWCLVDTQVPIPIPGWSVLIPILTKREVRNCRLRGNRLLFGYALTVFCRADSARPLIGCLDMNIVCWRQCSDQSEARIPVTARYRILAGVGGPRRCRAVPDLPPPIGMLYLVLITSLHIYKTKIHARNSNRTRFPLTRQNLTVPFSNSHLLLIPLYSSWKLLIYSFPPPWIVISREPPWIGLISVSI